MSGPAHILMTADAVGGVWTYALDLCEGLRAEGTAVTLALLGPPPSDAQRAGAASIPLIETGLPLDWTSEATPEALRAAGEEIVRLAKLAGADLVHLNAPILAAEARFPMPVLGACHSCLATWWEAVKGGAMPEPFRWRTALLGEGYRRCDTLIAPSRSFAEATAQRYGVSVQTVPNGRRVSSVRRGERRAVALTAGRLWDEGKNLALLDRAAGRMRFPVEAAGPTSGPDGASIRLEHAATLGPLGSPALAARMAEAAVFVSTALYEPFGLGVLEAAQAGCALVISDIPTFRELWEGAALIVDPHDPQAIAQALDGLLATPERCAALGELARERARAFEPAAMVAGTRAAYRAAMEARIPA